IDGITRYQWPRIIAVHAPPRRSDEVRKLATVSASTAEDAPIDDSSACMIIATTPAIAAAARIAARNFVNSRPIVAQANTARPVDARSGTRYGAAATRIAPVSARGVRSETACRTDCR